jgi:GT2 family glycosyltransferase
MKPKFSIGIPTLNRADLLIPAFMFYKHDFPDTQIFILDNGKQSLYRNIGGNSVTYILSYKNQGVAASWNWLIEIIFKKPEIKYAVILNDDIYWGQDQESFNIDLENYEREYKATNEFQKGFILAPDRSKYDWCMFVISREAWATIGKFDETFYPAYFEDSDYKYRAKLAGVPVYDILKPPARFVTSGTADKDKSILDHVSKNRDYYISKWGGEPGKEIYTVPFNGENKPSNGENKPSEK